MLLNKYSKRIWKDLIALLDQLNQTFTIFGGSVDNFGRKFEKKS